MPKPLTAQQVAAITKDGNYWIDRNLYLQIRGASRSYRLRYQLGGRDRSMGLGSTRLFTLTEARRRAVDALRLLADGKDPIAARRAERRTERVLTFEEATDAYVASAKAGWSPKHAENWPGQLKRHTGAIAKLPCDQIDANHVVSCLQKIWTTIPTTAGNVRGRIETVLDYAKAAGHRSGENPAAWKGNLEYRLPPLSRVQTIVHRVAVPWAEAPAVYGKLATLDTTHSRLLRFIILTAVRAGEARHCTWSEFDLEAEQPVWTIPASRSKNRKPHRVPLSPAAVEIINQMRGNREAPTGLVFKGRAPGKPPSDVVLRTLLRRFTPPDTDVHGWRSTARDWAADHGYSSQVAEAMLAHTLGSKIEVAYLRSDLFGQRIVLMNSWAAYLTGTKAS